MLNYLNKVIKFYKVQKLNQNQVKRDKKQLINFMIINI